MAITIRRIEGEEVIDLAGFLHVAFTLPNGDTITVTPQGNALSFQLENWGAIAVLPRAANTAEVRRVIEVNGEKQFA